MKILLGIQARSKSKRLPGKIYETIGERPILKWVYDSCKEAETLTKIPCITSVLGPKNDPELEAFTTKNLMRAVFPSCSENDLMSRYLIAADMLECTHIIRITSDCPFIEPKLIALIAEKFKEDDYISNTGLRTFPEGLDCQGCSVKAHRWLLKREDMEHPYLNLDMNSSFRAEFAAAGFRYGQILNPQFAFLVKGFSVDTKEDLENMRRIYADNQKRGAPFEM